MGVATPAGSGFREAFPSWPSAPLADVSRQLMKTD
jgi:hypothetical protein